MKITDIPNKDESHIEKKQFEKKEILVGRIVPHHGHTLFQYNTKTREITKAEFDNIPTISWQDAVNNNFQKYSKVIKKPNCLYISALNEANVKKILLRDYNIKT